MIEGVVNEFREAVVDLVVAGPTGTALQLEFLIGTGFGGGVTLHSSVAAALGLHAFGVEEAVLADGSVVTFPFAEAVLRWDGIARPVQVDFADTVPLVGMRVLEGHELRLEAVPEGRVQITALN
jgi:predicted aspartyl protease